MKTNNFRELWVVDFEFKSSPGDKPEPLCMVAKEFWTGKSIRLWKDDLMRVNEPPFGTGSDSLFISYYSPAELGCFLALDWPFPFFVLDLYPEFRAATNGLETPFGRGLIGALGYYGLDSISALEKEGMREIVLNTDAFTPEMRESILGYCESDVRALEKLFDKMQYSIDLSHALHRGNYMKSVALMEYAGVPIDTEIYCRLKEQWPDIQNDLIRQINDQYGVYEDNVFKSSKFEEYLFRNNIPWVRLMSGRLALDEDTFSEMKRTHTIIAPLAELRSSLSQMKQNRLAVGKDGRNRVMLSPFGAKTGRNQPSTSQFIFGPAVWMRGLIKPSPGMAIAYVDYEQQEFAIAAALSKDEAMMSAYLSDDPYISFAKMAGAVPPEASKKTHPRERELYKTTALALQYAMGPKSLSMRLGITEFEGRELIARHKRVFKKFWTWSDAAVDLAILNKRIATVFGWPLFVTENTNDRTLRNFPVQANGAEMLRLACTEAIAAGVTVCAPVHDALLIEAPLAEIDSAVEKTQKAMKKAGETVLSGFPLRTEAKIVKYPHRYMDMRGIGMWETVMSLLR